MEGYRSYPEGRPGYSEGLPPESDYSESAGWYAERGYREPERFDDPRREPGRPSPGPAEPARATAGAPRPGPLPGEETPTQRRPPPAGPGAVAPGSPGPGSPGPAGGDSVYRSRRPGTAALMGVPAVLLELPALFLLRDATFADPASASGVVGAICLVLALPMLAIGLYGVATGAVRAAGPNSGQAWLRPPVAYLTVALVLFVAAGLAA